MDLIDYLAKFFLLLGDPATLILLTIIGFNAWQRKIWAQALFILLFTMILNTLLKYFFHVPLMPHLLKAGFAFPSGHMQAAVAFYGWLILNYRHPLVRSVLLVVLTGIGFSLIYFHYHSFVDIAGAVCFGSLVLLLYYYAANITLFRKHPPLLGLALCLLAIPMILFLGQQWRVPTHLWKGIYVLLGFSLAWAFFYQRLTRRTPAIYAILCILATLVALSIVYYGFPPITREPDRFAQLPWLLIGLLPPTITRLFNAKYPI